MKSVRNGVFETNSSSTHSLSINKHSFLYFEEDIVSGPPKDEEIVLGEYENYAFLSNVNSREFKGFTNKLICIIALLISFYDELDSIDDYDSLYDRFKHSCHYIWICEMLKEKCNCTLKLRFFRYSTFYIEDVRYFLESNFPIYYPKKFKESVWNILTNDNIVLDYYSEEW